MAVIPAGETDLTEFVLPEQDGIDETDERFTINLHNPTGETIAAGKGTLIIIDD